MLETGITPDFIVVDGAEGGTGAAPVEFTDHVGVPLQEGLLLVHNTLVGVNLRHRIKIGAAGKVITAFDIARMMALGADWCNFGRGFMMALGCIQAQSCHTGPAPPASPRRTPVRQQALVVPDKATRVANFHRKTLHALMELVQAAGLQHPAISRPTTSCAAPATARCTCCPTWCCCAARRPAGAAGWTAQGVPDLLAAACAESFHIAPPPMTPSAERPQNVPQA
jgi:glutamate synthase domain-containing protein 2